MGEPECFRAFPRPLWVQSPPLQLVVRLLPHFGAALASRQPPDYRTVRHCTEAPRLPTDTLCVFSTSSLVSSPDQTPDECLLRHDSFHQAVRNTRWQSTILCAERPEPMPNSRTRDEISDIPFSLNHVSVSEALLELPRPKPRVFLPPLLTEVSQ